MIKCTVKSGIVLVALGLWLVFGQMVSGGRKKKEQPEEARQAVHISKAK